MKIQSFQNIRRGDRGSAVILLLALVAIMLILITAESRALFQLHREVKWLEQQQIKRLSAPPHHSATNVVVIARP
jgi:hypothetical protein